MIATTQVKIAFQIGLRLQQVPCRVIGLRPVFPENAVPNLSGLCQFNQTPLHRNADVTTRARRSVSVDYLQQRVFLLACEGNLALKTLQCLLHRRQIRLDVYGFDGAVLRGCFLWIRVPVLRWRGKSNVLCESKAAASTLALSTQAESGVSMPQRKKTAPLEWRRRARLNVPDSTARLH